MTVASLLAQGILYPPLYRNSLRCKTSARLGHTLGTSSEKGALCRA